MPVDSSYELQQDAEYTLPVRGGGPIDIASSASLLWMALNHQVRSEGRRRAPCIAPITAMHRVVFQLVLAILFAVAVTYVVLYVVPNAQVLEFDLSASAPDPTTFDLSAAISGVNFQAKTVRVIASSAATTTLLVGGVDNTYPLYNGIVIYGTVAAGSSTFSVTGSVVLSSFGAGVTALSQTSPLHAGFVLASTDAGVFKCACQPSRNL